MSNEQMYRGLVLIQFDIDEEVDDDGCLIDMKIDSQMQVIASGNRIPDQKVLLALATGLANWVDDSDEVREIEALDEVADALDLENSVSVAGCWTSLNARHYRGLNEHGAAAQMAKGELVLWMREDEDVPIWFLTLAGSQIGFLRGGGYTEDNPPTEWADGTYRAFKVSESQSLPS